MKKTSLFLLLTLLSLCSIAGTEKVDTTPNTHQISILTYNIKMLPRIAFTIKHHPVKRARLIPEKLMTESPDVIVFQEGFDGLAIRILRKKLKPMYPYTAGYNNHKIVTYKRAGGVLMFSKYPMKEIESIKYSQCKGIDCAGHKGALLVSVDHPTHRFQLLGTHIQAGGSKEIKFSQYIEAGALLKRHEVAGEPQFAAGDFNTKRSSDEMYTALTKALDCEDGAITGECQYTSDHLLNDMDSYNPDKRNLIDYVFFKGNGVKPISAERTVKVFTQKWHAKHKDLSDHFAVLLKMKLQ